MPQSVVRCARRPAAEIDAVGLVAMRDKGATWQAIGRAFRLQESKAKAFYDRFSAPPTVIA
jgi:hypothetical protein